MNYCFQNIRLIDAETDKVADLFIQNGKIQEKADPNTTYEKINGTGKILMPGVIDPHVHFREPGFEYKEDLESGSRAAISGGVTGVFEMPNTNPPTFTRTLLAAKKKIAAKKCFCHYAFYFGAGPDNQAEIEAVKGVPGTKLYLNTTTGNLKMDQESRWEEIFKIGKKVALHAEGETFERAVEIWLKSKAPCELHLCHASLRREVELVRTLKKNPDYTSKISMEVCPHHLFMTHEDRERYGAFCCMKPQLATEDDLKAMWEGVLDGTIDMFATDHAPHTREEKESDQIYYGIPGVETLFPLLFNEFTKQKYDLKKLAAMTSHKIIKTFKVPHQKGLLKPGYDADLLVVDPNKKYHLQAKNFYSKCRWTPYENWEVQGSIHSVWLSGKLAFNPQKGILGVKGQDLFADN